MPRSNTLAPGFLVASPRLDGSLFERSVIIMVHHDEEGAMGFIVNRPLEVDFGSLLEMVEMRVESIEPDCYERDVFFGGPVRVEQLWLIYNGQTGEVHEDPRARLDENSDLRFHERWALSGASASIESFAFGSESAAYRPFIGYAGWGPGQLEEEIGEGSWLLLDFEERLVFETPPARMWKIALDKLGVDETTFAMMGKAGQA